MARLRTLLTGLAIGESPRWHAGRLWFSNWVAQEIIAVDPDGNSEIMLRVPFSTFPFSIDWLPDGRRLMCSGSDRPLLRTEPDGSLVTHADTRSLSKTGWNEIVVDARGMYLGSANLTGAGLGAKADGRRNFELGVWTESPALIDAVLGHFNELWEGRQCKSCRRKDVCPVPLEEPRL